MLSGPRCLRSYPVHGLGLINLMFEKPRKSEVTVKIEASVMKPPKNANTESRVLRVEGYSNKISYIKMILKVQELFRNSKLRNSNFYIKIIVLVTLNTRGVSGGHHFGYTKLGKERSALFTFFGSRNSSSSN